MKNTPVNNDYVQNLQEGLLNETRRRPEGTPMGDLQAADSEKRREATQDAINDQDARDGGAGVASDIEHGRWERDIKGEGGSVRTGKKKPGNKPKRGYTRNDGSKVTYPRINTAGRRVEKNEPFTESAGRVLKKVDENAQAGYPKEGIEGGTVEAKKREYEKKVEDKKRERLAAAPALASLQNQKN